MSPEQARRELRAAIFSAFAKTGIGMPAHAHAITAAIEALIDAKLANPEPKTPSVIGFPEYGTNAGHGHVWERPDGNRMRCGGPGLCKDCSLDQARLNRMRAERSPGVL